MMSYANLQSEREKVHTACRDAIVCQTFDTILRTARPATVYNPATRSEELFKATPTPGLARPLAIVRKCLEACGVPRGVVDQIEAPDLARIAISSGASIPGISAEAIYNSTGMFQSIMLDAQNTVLRTSYQDQTTFQLWAKEPEDGRRHRGIPRLGSRLWRSCEQDDRRRLGLCGGVRRNDGEDGGSEGARRRKRRPQLQAAARSLPAGPGWKDRHAIAIDRSAGRQQRHRQHLSGLRHPDSGCGAG
jgi:hypothetical protein